MGHRGDLSLQVVTLSWHCDPAIQLFVKFKSFEAVIQPLPAISLNAGHETYKLII